MKYFKIPLFFLSFILIFNVFGQSKQEKAQLWNQFSKLELKSFNPRIRWTASNVPSQSMIFIIPGTFDQLSIRQARAYNEIAYKYGFNFYVITMEIEASIDLELLENVNQANIILDTTHSALLELGFDTYSKAQLNRYLGYGYNLPNILKQKVDNCKVPRFMLGLYDETKAQNQFFQVFTGKTQIPEPKDLEKYLKTKQYTKVKKR